MLSESLLIKFFFCFCILKYIFLYKHFNGSIFIEQKNYHFIFQNNQKIVQTLLKWLFSTSINLDIIWD